MLVKIQNKGWNENIFYLSTDKQCQDRQRLDVQEFILRTEWHWLSQITSLVVTTKASGLVANRRGLSIDVEGGDANRLKAAGEETDGQWHLVARLLTHPFS